MGLSTAVNQGMLAFIDLEHPSLAVHHPEVMDRVAYRRIKTKYLLEELSGLDCLIVRYDRVDVERFKRLGIRALILSGNHTDIHEYNAECLEGLNNLLKTFPFPMLCICGSHQLLVKVNGGTMCPIGSTVPGQPEAEGDDTIPRGMIHEMGYCEVSITRQDPLFNGLGNPLKVYQHHYWEARDLPEEFEVLAESRVSPLQAIRHKEHLCYGVQFHPEDYNKEYPDGERILRNFIALVT